MRQASCRCSANNLPTICGTLYCTTACSCYCICVGCGRLCSAGSCRWGGCCDVGGLLPIQTYIPLWVLVCAVACAIWEVSSSSSMLHVLPVPLVEVSSYPARNCCCSSPVVRCGECIKWYRVPGAAAASPGCSICLQDDTVQQYRHRWHLVSCGTVASSS